MDDDELIVRLARGDDRALRELFQRHAPMPAAWRTPSTTRLAWLHLRSRRVPSALAALAGCGAVLWAALAHHWWPETGHTASEFPMFIEGGAAAVIAVTTHSPFGEPERAAGRWLPFLRLSTALVLCGAAIGLLALAAAVADNPQAGIGLSTGILAVAENVLRFAGIGLVFSRITGGLTAWTGPLGFMSVCQFAKVANFSEPLTWAARPAADRAAGSPPWPSAQPAWQRSPSWARACARRATEPARPAARATRSGSPAPRRRLDAWDRKSQRLSGRCSRLLPMSVLRSSSAVCSAWRTRAT